MQGTSPGSSGKRKNKNTLWIIFLLFLCIPAGALGIIYNIVIWNAIFSEFLTVLAILVGILQVYPDLFHGISLSPNIPSKMWVRLKRFQASNWLMVIISILSVTSILLNINLYVILASQQFDHSVNNKPSIPVSGRSTFPPTSVPSLSPSRDNSTPTSTSTQNSGGVITTNQWLPCTQCNTPIRIRIDTITIDSINGNTVLAVTLVNNSGAAQDGCMEFFKLQDTSGSTHTGTGDLLTCYSSYSLNSGRLKQGQIVFPNFLPQLSQSYKFTMELYVYDYSPSTIDYDPVSVTFTAGNVLFSFSTATRISTIADAALKKNQWLICTQCNTPIRIRIDTITIDTTNARTVWAITLDNTSGAAQDGCMEFFKLQDTTNSTFTGTGDLLSCYSSYNLDAGKTQAYQIIFPFLPYPGQHYMLSVELYVYGYSPSAIDYDAISLSF